MAHPYFLSYARQDSLVRGDPSRKDRHFEKFLDYLDYRVGQLLTFGPGFVDRSIQAGEDWSDEIAEALRTTQTMVCLYSPHYFESEYCGKELQVLLDRRKLYIDANPGNKPA